MDSARSAYACLNELQQCRWIDELVYTDMGKMEDKWLARIYARRGIIVWEETAAGAGKSEAKKAAGARMMQRILEEFLEDACVMKISKKTVPVQQNTRKIGRQRREKEYLSAATSIAQAVQTGGRTKILVAVDVEAWMQDHSKVTEVGVASMIVDAEGHTYDMARHLLVRENLGKDNAGDLDCKFRFRFGESEIMDQREVAAEISNILRAYSMVGDVMLVGHSIQCDLKWLRGLGVDIDVVCCDVAVVHRELRNKAQVKGLEGILEELGVDCKWLHNAGNDAMYTLWVMAMLLKEMIS